MVIKLNYEFLTNTKLLIGPGSSSGQLETTSRDLCYKTYFVVIKSADIVTEQGILNGEVSLYH